VRQRTRPAAFRSVGRRPLRGALVGGALLGAALLLWLGFAPASIGGNFSYVLIQGDSMAPTVNHGDVVLLRQRNDYDPGDIVAYRHPNLGVVLHRVTIDHGGRFTVQGDNRNTADAYHPAPDDIIGEGFRTLPRVGAALRALQAPGNVALLITGAIGLGIMTQSGDQQQQRRRRPNRSSNDDMPRGERTSSEAPRRPRARPSARRAPLSAPFLRSLEPVGPSGRPPQGPGGVDLGRFSYYGPWGGQLLTILMAIMLVAIALPLVTSTQGSTELTTTAVPYGIQGELRYGPEATGQLFQDTTDAPPQPVFRALTSQLPVVYEYTVASESAFEPENVTGSYELVAEVRHANGWRQPLVIQRTTLFAGNSAALNGVLDLDAVDAIIADFEAATGITSDIYELGLIATISIEGELAGQPFSRHVVHPSGFRLTDLQLQFDDRIGDLQLLDGGTVTTLTATSKTVTLPLFGTEIAYTDFPRIAVTILIFCGFGLATLGLITYQTFRAGERARIHSRYDHLLVEVASDRIPATHRVLRVARFGDLVRVAEREGLPILAAAPPLAGRHRQDIEPGAPYPNSPLRRDPRALIESFLAGDEEALAIVDGAQADLEQAEIVDNIVDLSGQYFVIDGDLTYRYVADEVLPGSRFERGDYYYDEAA